LAAILVNLCQNSFSKGPLRVHAKNKFTFSSVEAPAWQGAKAQNYQDISSFRNAARRDASALENVKLFLREP
jgi:hypothetical protein